MKVRFDLLASAFFVAALAFAGCSNNDEDPAPPLAPPPGPTESTYTLSVTGVTPDAAVVSVTPSNTTERYWVDAIEKTQYDSQCSGTPEGLKTYLPTLMAARAQAAGKTIAELITAEGKVGNATKNLQSLKVETDHIAFAIAVDANGNGTSKAKVEPFKTLAAVVEGPAYVVTVTDVEVTTATLNAVPTNKTEVYWLDYMPKATYETLCSGTPEGLATYMPGMLQRLVDAGFTMETILSILGKTGDAKSEVDELDPATEHIAYAVGVNIEGQVTNVPVVTPFTTKAATGTAPTVTLSMTPGDKDGAEPQTNMLVKVKSSDVASFKYGFFDNAEVLSLINAGQTYEYIINRYGKDATAADITAINNTEGWATTFVELTPGTEYCLIIKAMATGGLSAIEHMEKSTAPAGEASEDYKAWLGTWTVTSTSSVVGKAPVSFDLVISQKVANTTYKASGWGITELRDKAPAAISLKYNTDGTFSILNEQTFGRDETPPAGMNAFCLGVPYGAGYSPVTGAGVPGITATLSTDKQSATAIGNVVNIGGADYTTAYMDYIFLGDDDKIYRYGPAPGCTAGDYAIVPLTMTKKSAAPAVAPYRGVMPKAFALSREGRMLAATLNSGQATVTTANARVTKIDMSRMADEASMREIMRRR